VLLRLDRVVGLRPGQAGRIAEAAPHEPGIRLSGAVEDDGQLALGLVEDVPQFLDAASASLAQLERTSFSVRPQIRS